MDKSTSALVTPLRDQLDKLAAFEPRDGAPVLSLYLDMRPDQHGRASFDAFLRKTFDDRARTLNGAVRTSFDRDVERIHAYLSDDLRRSANGLAIFASHAAGLFETIQLDAPLEQHWLFIGDVPHLYPLARVNDQFPRYAAVVADTNSARLFVFGLGSRERDEQVRNQKTRRTSMGGWSQARYQRHVANFHQQHVKEVVDVLDRVVREESINHVILACDEVTRPLIVDELPAHLSAKVIDVLKLDIRASERQVLEETLEALRQKDADADVEHVQTMVGAARAGGLGVVGPEDTLLALEMGQVEELLIAATPASLDRVGGRPESPVEIDTSATGTAVEPEQAALADRLVTKAQLTSARIRFIEDPTLLEEFGGVGAILRFKV